MTEATERPPRPPPPTTRTVGESSRLGLLPWETSGGRGVAGWSLTSCPSSTPVMQASVPGRSSTTHGATRGRRPIPQKTPRRPPSTASRKPISPAATSADASVSPANPSTGRPSKVSRTDSAGGSTPGTPTRTLGSAFEPVLAHGTPARWWPTGRDSSSPLPTNSGGWAGCWGGGLDQIGGRCGASSQMAAMTSIQ